VKWESAKDLRFQNTKVVFVAQSLGKKCIQLFGLFETKQIPHYKVKNLGLRGIKMNFCDYGGYCGPGSSVGIAIDYGLDGPGSNPGGGRDFPPVQTCPGAHPDSCKMGAGSFPGIKSGRGVLLTTHPLLVPQTWKSRVVPLPTLWATPGLYRHHFTLRGILLWPNNKNDHI